MIQYIEYWCNIISYWVFKHTPKQLATAGTILFVLFVVALFAVKWVHVVCILAFLLAGVGTFLKIIIWDNLYEKFGGNK